jgi:signal transduction histidine kinase
MNIYSRRQLLKFLLFIVAAIIGISSLMYTNRLVKQLSIEEKKKVQLWAEATKQLARSDMENVNLGFFLDVIQDNNTIPVILADSKGRIVQARNLDSLRMLDESYLYQQFEKMKINGHTPIEVDFGKDKNYIYYTDSTILLKLSYYPYIQLFVISLFIIVSYFAFNASREAEQNRVWLGLSKETAHQLGTPTSSLLAWIEILKLRNVEPKLVGELANDVKRLEKITERFSKIGSTPALLPSDIFKTIDNAIQYLKKRLPDKVSFSILPDEAEIIAPVNPELFEWVIENLCKNATDAMVGDGSIKIWIKQSKQYVTIDIKDTGKGIPKSKFKTVFKPGYTTKQKGWGLGLSLTKRIVETYHKGKIFVLDSEVGKGTTFRIVLNKV